MGTVGNDNERLKILLYNAVEIIYETWYQDVDYATFVDGIKDEIGFTNWEDFTQAEAFGTTSIRTRFGLAFDKYKDNPEVMADLVSTTKADENDIEVKDDANH